MTLTQSQFRSSVSARWSGRGFGLFAVTAALALVMTAAPAASEEGGDWPQWAGPGRDFQAPVSADTLTTWPAGGLEKLWEQPLGLGYSSIAVADGRVITVDRDGDVERVVCLSAEDGSMTWSHSYDAPHLDGMRVGYGTGPHATPLIHNGRVFGVGTTGRLYALDLQSGEPLWHRELWQDLDGTFLVRGYAASPLVFEDTLLITLGGEDGAGGLGAFRAADGELLWRRVDFKNSQSSPILVQTADEGGPMVVAFVNDELVAIDARRGDELWRVKHKSGAAYNIGTPIFDPDTSRIYVSSAYGGGTRALKVSREEAKEIWHTGRMKVHYTNMLLIDDHLYGTTGNAGTVILAALDTADGKMLWKDREIVRSQLVKLADRRALALTEDGRLALLSLSPEGVKVLGDMRVADQKTWSPPTVTADRLYVRNESRMMAFAIPRAESGEP